MIQIAIEGLRFHAFHGVHEEERRNGQEYCVDMYVHCPEENVQDNLNRTIDYQMLALIAEREMQQASHLIEDVAERIIRHIESKKLNIVYLKVRIHKPQPPIGLPCDKVFVEIEKSYA